jgi:hypothetical protein
VNAKADRSSSLPWETGGQPRGSATKREKRAHSEPTLDRIRRPHPALSYP